MSCRCRYHDYNTMTRTIIRTCGLSIFDRVRGWGRNMNANQHRMHTHREIGKEKSVDPSTKLQNEA